MSHSPEVILVGGGVAGLMAAYALGKQGVSVHLYERQALAQESSWAGGGILSPLYPWRYPEPVNALAQRSLALYPAWVESLKADSGIDPELFQTGMLIGLDEQSPAVLDWLKTYQQAHVWLAPQDLAAEFPHFSFHSAEVLALPVLANIRNPRLLKALLGALKRLPSVKIFEQCPVVQFFSEAGAVKGVQLASGERVFALKVVLTAGAWSGDLSPQASPIDVKPVKGQMILFAPSPFVSTMLLEEERYFIPRKDGRVLVGSSVEHVGFDKQTDALMRDALIDFAVSRCPALANVPVETHWAGLRPGSPEGVPYIGQSQTVSGLFYNTGHFRNGLVLQPASVERLLASMGYSVRF